MPSKSGCGGSIAHLLRLSTPTSPSNHTMAAALRNASSSLRAAPLQARRLVAAAPVSRSAAMRLAPLRSVATKAPEVADYAVEERGPKESLEYRIAFRQNDKVISCWHEIPLWAGEEELHFICEIPKETSAKMEVATDEPSTPIKQDTKKGKLRFYPYNINWNYGLLPQTWEDPDHKNADLGGVAGDNDPVDVVEIGDAQLKMGGVYRVKPLGVYAMIDDGELDWKVIAINSADPKAAKVNSLEDVEREFPGQLTKIYEWFRDYKMPDGKPPNAFGYDNKCMDKAFAMKVIDETHRFYVSLKSGKRANSEDLSLI